MVLVSKKEGNPGSAETRSPRDTTRSQVAEVALKSLCVCRDRIRGPMLRVRAAVSATALDAYRGAAGGQAYAFRRSLRELAMREGRAYVRIVKALSLLLALMCSLSAEPLSPEQEKNARDQALAAFLAQGGGLRKSGSDNKAGFVYTEGKLKGLTKEQAIQRFYLMWDKVSPEVRAKYAARGPVVSDEKKEDEAADKAQFEKLERERKSRQMQDEIDRLKRERK